MRLLFILSLLFALSVEAAVTLEYISSKPSSRARDFMIWQFLQQEGTSPADAIKAFGLVDDKNNPKIKKLYAKLVDDGIRRELACKERDDLLDIENDICLDLAFSPYKTIKMSRFERDKLLTRNLSSINRQLLQLQNEPYSFSHYTHYNPSVVIKYLASLPKSLLRQKLNQQIYFDMLELLMMAPNFNEFVLIVTTDYNLDRIHRSLFNLPVKKLDFQSSFYLGLNALRYSKTKQAIKYLKASNKKASLQKYKDRAVFWLYLATRDVAYLEELLLSMDINVYTLYAHEKMDIEVVNFFHDVVTVPSYSPYDLKDPFDWLAILNTIKDTHPSKLFSLIDRYRYQDLIPVQRFVMERAYNYKMHGYITPYDRYMQGMDTEDKALVYAIMRRESNYIPSAISRSFALGLMQLMPFLVDHIAKKQKEKIDDYRVMFDPQKNLRYAMIHLEWLQKVLHNNPLFIAYAYNGGYGFFRRYKEGGRFLKKSFEPFLSMEMMKNSQTREYGKYVLANYTMYKKIYGEPFSIVDFFEKLK